MNINDTTTNTNTAANEISGNFEILSKEEQYLIKLSLIDSLSGCAIRDMQTELEKVLEEEECNELVAAMMGHFGQPSSDRLNSIAVASIALAIAFDGRLDTPVRLHAINVCEQLVTVFSELADDRDILQQAQH